MTAAMEKIDWSEDLESGIEVMDAQHKRYLELLNQYLEQVSRAKNVTEEILELAETFHFLRRYAAEHFITEEEVMLKVDYPDFEFHRDEHNYFLKHVEELYQTMKSEGHSPDLVREVRYYTVEWFIEHIRLTDQKFVNFLNEKALRDQSVAELLGKIFRSLFGKKPED